MRTSHTALGALIAALLSEGAMPSAAQVARHEVAMVKSPRAISEPSVDVKFTRVRVNTGITLNIAQSGDPKGEPVLFLHGYSDSWFSWSLVADRLPRGIRAIMLDQRGHGRSDAPTCCYRLADMASDAVALLDALGIQQATVVGHSMGSFVAQRIAVSTPARVKRLVLVGSAETMGNPISIDVGKTVLSFGDTIPAAFIREFQESTVNGALPPGFLSRVLEESARVPTRSWRGVAEEIIADTNSVSSRISVPTLIVSGELDAVFTPQLADGLSAAVRGSTHRRYAKTGHAIHWEQPDRFVSDFLAFMKR